MLTPLGAPNVCRLLLEVSEDGFTPLSRFDWGPMASAPFLPRVTRGRVVLAPAQWTLDADVLPGSPGDPDAFHRAVQQWRKEWRVPRYGYLTWADNRLLLDLEHPLCTDELYRELNRGTGGSHPHPVQLQEALPDVDELWLRDGSDRRYHSELVVPLLARDRSLVARPPVPAAPAQDTARRAPATKRPQPTVTRRWLPGDRWTFLKLYSAPEQHDDVLIGPVRQLIADLRAGDAIERWFFIRYADPYPHLRLRFRAAPGVDPVTVLAEVAGWARDTTAAGLAADAVFASYDREVERYGGPAAIDVLEDVFHAGSDVTTQLLTLLRRGVPGLDHDLMCVLAVHTLHQQWSLQPQPGDPHHDLTDETRKRFRAVQPLLCDLLEPWDARPDPGARAVLPTLSAVLEQQRASVEAAAARVRDLSHAGALVGTERGIVDSLTHMQANRLLGLDRERERMCHRLWALTLRAVRGRPAR